MSEQSCESLPLLPALVTPTECSSCHTTHVNQEMSLCFECGGRFCSQCTCDCIPFTAEELAELAELG